MKEEQTKFICDKCPKKITIKKTGSGLLPYIEGWVYLSRVTFRVDNCGSLYKEDKHFCSPKCMINYIDYIVKESIKNVKAGKRGC